MMILLSLLLLWLSECLSSFGFLLLFFLLLPSQMLVLEKRNLSVVLNALLPAIVILFLPFRHYTWFFYITVVAWFAPVRTLCMRFRSPWVGSLLSFIFCNLSFFLALFLISLLGISPIGTNDLFWIAVYLFLSEIGFALLDVVYQLFRRFYISHFRRFLLA